jgi:acyl-CoA thioesterase I
MLSVTRFVAFGDSLTEGLVSPTPSILRRLNVNDAYPARLQGLLTQRYTAQTPTVLNRGKSGETAEEGEPRFFDMLRADQPQVVLLLEGVNDIAAQGSHGASIALASLERMLKEARGRGVSVFIATLPPERPGAPKTLDSAVLARFDDDIRRLARGEHAVLVDLDRELDPSFVGVDGLHLTEAGYDRMASIFFLHIVATKEAPPAAATSILTQKSPTPRDSGT